MKILIAYDGSAGANAALADLHKAALAHSADVLVLSVAEFAYGLLQATTLRFQKPRM